MMRRAGWSISVSSRSYFPAVNDAELEIVLLRAQEIPRYVADGVLDAGITGYDNVLENDVDVHEICELIYSKATSRPYRWVLAVPKGSDIRGPQDLQGKRIATELVNVTQRYLDKHGVKAEIEFSWGATEVKVPALVDAIVEGTETGSTLRAHNLEIIDELLASTTRFISNNESWSDEWKRQKLSAMATLLQGAMEAEGKVGLKNERAAPGFGRRGCSFALNAFAHNYAARRRGLGCSGSRGGRKFGARYYSRLVGSGRNRHHRISAQ